MLFCMTIQNIGKKVYINITDSIDFILVLIVQIQQGHVISGYHLKNIYFHEVNKMFFNPDGSMILGMVVSVCRSRLIRTIDICFKHSCPSQDELLTFSPASSSSQNFVQFVSSKIWSIYDQLLTELMTLCLVVMYNMLIN